MPSVAPVLITGKTIAPGYICLVRDSTTDIRSGRSGEDLLGCASFTKATEIFGSASTSVSLAFTAVGATPGRIRQFTLALAICGSALVACPPSSFVATHVVRIIAL